MLAESFLRQLCYREEDKCVSSSSKQNRPTSCVDVGVTGPQGDSVGLGPNQEDSDPPSVLVVQEVPQHPAGLRVPGCPPIPFQCPVSVEDCSLLDQYPDLQVADSAHIPNSFLKSSELEFNTYSHLPGAQQELQADVVSSMSDQGYLVMGSSVNKSLELEPGVEPLSNSVLNGLLEEQLKEVYMQHLTDNLARCQSYLENSLLRGLVTTLQPRNPGQGTDSLEVSLEPDLEDRGQNKSYTFSSNISSPVLRISEADDNHEKET